jgi:hypothetical protein
MGMRALLPLFALVTTLATAGASSAANKATARQSLEKAAKKACITGDFSKGVDILGDLYVETNDPTYVFNQGRCFEQSHQWTEAIDRFREYMRKVPTLPVDTKVDVEKHIAECKTQIAEQSVLPPAPAASPEVASPPAPAVQPAPPTMDAVVVVPVPLAASRSDGSGLRTAGIVVAAVGVAGIATGVALAFKTHSLTNQLNQPAGYDRDLAQTNKTYQTWGWISYGVGGAALAAGATLFILGHISGRSRGGAARLSLVPAFASGRPSLSLQGAY